MSSQSGQPIKSCPLAVITPSLGVRSETFIHRHITRLLPDRTAVIARNRISTADTFQPTALVLTESKGGLRWLYHVGCYLLGFEKLSPVQMLVLEYLQRHGVEVVLSEYLDKSLQWLEAAKRTGARFFAHAHGYDVSQALREPTMRRRYLHLESADGIITMSEHSKSKLVELGLSPGKIHVIPYGVDVPECLPKVGRAGGEIRCLAVGRMVAKKAPVLLLESFRRALGTNPQLRLDYVGDGELFNEASALVRKYDLGDKVTLHGSRPSEIVGDLMSKADIFLQHSRMDPLTGDEEGLPVAILEAMANGLPVVSTRHAGIPEAVLSGVTGYLVDEGDVAGMASAIAELADQPELSRMLGHAGWRRAKQYFSWERECDQLLELLGLTGIARYSVED